MKGYLQSICIMNVICEYPLVLLEENYFTIVLKSAINV